MPKSGDLRVLLVDDTVVYRKAISEILNGLPGVVAVGSAHTPEGSRMALKALELGAFYFVCKPQTGNFQENRAELKKVLAPMIKAFSHLRDVRRILKGKKQNEHQRPTEAVKTHKRSEQKKAAIISFQPSPRSRVVAIGVSTGGPVALGHILPKIPAHVGVPFLIVQHMPPMFTDSLARNLDRDCTIRVKEAVDGEIIEPDTAYIAPGGKQMKVADDVLKRAKIIRITDDPPENGCTPSADYLFRSVAEHYNGNATGVIMTGMGSDGASGLKRMKEKGAFIIAQDEESSVVYGMARRAVEMGIVDMVVPLDQMARQIRRTIPGDFNKQ